jgi:Cu(I)/Ag(I) efflux system periplasmic protein CusF
MKRLAAMSAILVLSISFAFTVQAQMKDMDMKGMEMKKDGGKAGQVHKGTGVIKKVDVAKGAVTLDHEPIKSVNWSAMTMTFNVKDKKILETVKTGQKVQFEFVQQGKENVITSIK